MVKKLKGRPRKITDEQINQIIHLDETTEWGTGLIARHMGLTKTTVYWYLQKHRKQKQQTNME